MGGGDDERPFLDGDPFLTGGEGDRAFFAPGELRLAAGGERPRERAGDEEDDEREREREREREEPEDAEREEEPDEDREPERPRRGFAIGGERAGMERG